MMDDAFWALEERMDARQGAESADLDEYEDIDRLYCDGARPSGPMLGRDGHWLDSRARWLHIELMPRTVLPAELQATLRQAQQYAGPGQHAAVVLHGNQTRRRDDIVCMIRADFERLFTTLPLPEGMDMADVQEGLEAGRTLAEIALGSPTHARAQA